MAASLDLNGMAGTLLDVGLASIDTQVRIARDLTKLDQVADLTTLKGIARLLLRHRPPDWLRSVVVDERVNPEFIPQGDAEALSWLGADLEPIIVLVHRELYGVADERLLKQLGDAGELAIMSALRRQGHRPRHVALVSDRFGYDIEHQIGARLEGLEVKAAVTSTAHRIFISRNEFEVAKRMGDRWRLVQVTFSSRVIACGRATTSDIESIRELSASTLSQMAPAETGRFRWMEAAEFRPEEADWRSAPLVVGDEFVADLA